MLYLEVLSRAEVLVALEGPELEVRSTREAEHLELYRDDISIDQRSMNRMVYCHHRRIRLTRNSIKVQIKEAGKRGT